MKIICGAKTGFCYGVKKAVETAETLAREASSPIYTFGPLIHNSYEVNRLKRLGVVPLNSLKKITNEIVLIRTHGLPKNIINKLIERKIKIIDTTCPFVKKVQNLIEKFSKNGYNIVITGDKNHPEVIGLVSYSEKPVKVINTISELNKLNLDEPVAIVSQTTYSEQKFNKFATRLKKKYKNIKILNTICNAASQRQKEAEEIAKQVQLMLVVGGKNSGNTIRLRNISSKYTKTFHIESYSDIKKFWFKKANSVGIITGTSTPQWIVGEIIKYLGSSTLQS